MACRVRLVTLWWLWWGVSGVLGDTLEVDTSHGTVSGVLEVSRNGTPYFAFRSIPYAKPPIGLRRFAKPEQPDPWDGVLDVSNEAPLCVQNMSSDSYHSQEDCLYLAVFTPSLNKKRNLPVFVFIHGGMLVEGTGPLLYRPNYFMDHPIVVVTLNYRLGALGFLSLGEDWLPSNLGLWDQLEALRWVKSNIHNFGGDPNKVTLGGHSVGSLCTHLLMMSGRTKGLINQGILMAGTADELWAFVEASEARRRALKALSILGCPYHPSNASLACLRKVPSENFVSLLGAYEVGITKPLYIFAPTVDSFSPQSFFQYADFQRSERRNLLTGVAQDEGVIGMYQHPGWDYAKTYLKELNHNFSWLAPYEYRYGEFGQYPEISAQIRQFYFGSMKIQPGVNLTNLYGDAWVYCGEETTIEKYKGTLYRYTLVTRPKASVMHPGQENYPPGDYGATHGDELFFLFNMSKMYPERVLAPEEVPLSELMVKLWSNFIISGQPGEVEFWPPSKQKEMAFSTQGSYVRRVQREDRRFLWRSIREQLLNHTLKKKMKITGIILH